MNHYPKLQFGKGISPKIWQCLVSIVNFRGAEYLLQNITGLPQCLNARLVGVRGLSFQHLFGVEMFLFEKLFSCFIDEITLTWICQKKQSSRKRDDKDCILWGILVKYQPGSAGRNCMVIMVIGIVCQPKVCLYR